MKRIHILALLIMTCSTVWAQMPYAEPTAVITAPADKEGELGEESEYQAPLTVSFKANPQTEGWQALYEWRITQQGSTAPAVVRYDEDMEYTFTQSGTWEIDLFVTFVNGTDSIVYDRVHAASDKYAGPLMDKPFVVGISQSYLEFPNAFSPNGDGHNDYLNAKVEGNAKTRSLISFEATVFSRWGKKIYSWTDWRNQTSGWDGTDGGHRCPDGAYYLVVKARGADGHHYNIRKTITLLTGYHETDD